MAKKSETNETNETAKKVTDKTPVADKTPVTDKTTPTLVADKTPSLGDKLENVVNKASDNAIKDLSEDLTPTSEKISKIKTEFEEIPGDDTPDLKNNDEIVPGIKNKDGELTEISKDDIPDAENSYPVEDLVNNLIADNVNELASFGIKLKVINKPQYDLASVKQQLEKLGPNQKLHFDILNLLNED